MIKIKKIAAENFMSFGRLDLDISSLPEGVCVVTGINEDTSDSDSNGAGKSTLFEALSWILFGKTHKGIGKDAIVKDGAVETIGTLWFEVDGHKVKVVRSKNINKAETLQIYLDNEELCTTERLRHTQSRLEELLEVDYSKFINMVYLSSASYGSFGMATDKDKKAVLEQFIPPILQQVYAGAKDKLEDAKMYKREQEVKVAQLEEHMNSARGSVAAKEQELAEKQKELESIDLPEVEVMDNDGLINKVNYYRDKVYKIQRVGDALSAKEKEIDKLGDEILAIEARSDKKCHVCKQVWEGARENKQKELEKLSKIYEAAEEELEKFKKENEELLDDDLNDLKLKYEEANKELKKYNSAELHRQTLQKRKHTLEGHIESLTKVIADSKMSIQESDKKLQECNNEIAEVTKIIEVVEVVKIAFSRNGIPAAILDKLLEEMQARVNFYLDRLYNKALSVTINSLRELKSGDVKEEIEFIIRSPKGVRDYRTLSGGEKRRIDVAFILALREIYLTKKDVAFNILILDEIFDALDTTGGQRIIDVLGETLGVDHIFVIAPTDEYRLLVDNSLQVVKNNGNSTIEL